MTERPAAPAPQTGTRHPRRGLCLGVLALVQFVFVLDLTVVNVALPSIGGDLGFSAAGLAWVVNGYALMAGGLLLLGGRTGDLLGRRRVFLSGVAVFTAASLLCSVATTPALLVIGRFAQGIGEAFAAPAAVGLVVALFSEPEVRSKALGLFASLSGLGGVLGITLSGVVNEFTTWRWIFLVNIPVGVVVLVIVPRLIEAGRRREVSSAARPDLPGAALITVGAVAIVYALLESASQPWGSVAVVVPLVVGLLAVAAFVLVERRTTNPLVPPGFFANRNRMTACVATLLYASGFFAMFFLLTLFVREVLRWSPLETGLAYLPYGLCIVVGAVVAGTVVPRTGARPVLVTGCVLTAAGLLLLSVLLSPGATFVGAFLPATLVIGIGAGLTLPILTVGALDAVTDGNSGLASGVQTSAAQIGAALGVALLVSVSSGAGRDAAAAGLSDSAAVTAGYLVAFQVAALAALVAALVAATLMRPGVGRRFAT